MDPSEGLLPNKSRVFLSSSFYVAWPHPLPPVPLLKAAKGSSDKHKETFFREDERLESSHEELGKGERGRGNRVNKRFRFETPSAMKEQVIQATGIPVHHLVSEAALQL